uniref:Uncharacterized protein n=1 Tax=Avena sativa TaxID=4498 RepID=A0ACD5UDW2_AVESA
MGSGHGEGGLDSEHYFGLALRIGVLVSVCSRDERPGEICLMNGCSGTAGPSRDHHHARDTTVNRSVLKHAQWMTLNPLLNNAHYDVQHRAYKMSEKRQELQPLRLRYHEVSSGKMRYDTRYTPYIQQLGLLPFIHMVTRSTPAFNPAAITALVDRWRPETHTFHLRTGETTITLQDMSMILALPIEGNPVCMSSDSDGWREEMVSLIGKDPPEAINKKGGKLRVAAGATFTWIIQNFKICPEDADEETIKTYTRVYVWYIITRTLFPDSSGDRAQWHWLKLLVFFDSTFSWGSAALAWLYRQLDDACLRSSADSGIGGCLLLLSVWSWEHFSIGRPRLLSFNPYIDNGNNYLLPTWAYKWDVVSEPPTDPLEAYKRYTNEFDTITMDQVTWEPYGRGDHFGVPEDYRLNPICLRESRLWLMRCPMVCMWAIEYHQPHRVMTQFGLFQIVPPEWKDTDIGLHSLDRNKQRKEKDWPKLHRKHLEKFRRCVTEARKAKGAQDRPFNRDAFNNYIAWFVDNARVEIYPRAFRDSILEEPLVFDELSTEQYNIMVREGQQTEFAPLVNFVRDHVRKSADACEDALDTYPRGEKGEGLFREFVKK